MAVIRKYLLKLAKKLEVNDKVWVILRIFKITILPFSPAYNYSNYMRKFKDWTYKKPHIYPRL